MRHTLLVAPFPRRHGSSEGYGRPAPAGSSRFFAPVYRKNQSRSCAFASQECTTPLSIYEKCLYWKSSETTEIEPLHFGAAERETRRRCPKKAAKTGFSRMLNLALALSVF